MCYGDSHVQIQVLKLKNIYGTSKNKVAVNLQCSKSSSIMESRMFLPLQCVRMLTVLLMVRWFPNIVWIDWT
ncbi:unnamed protein product, partial [Thlaspi arvense]